MTTKNELIERATEDVAEIAKVLEREKRLRRALRRLRQEGCRASQLAIINAALED